MLNPETLQLEMVWIQTISGHQTIHIIHILQSNCHDKKHTHCRSKRLKFCDPLACAASASRSSCLSLSSRGSSVWPAEASPGMGDRRHVQNLVMSLYTGGFTGVPLMDSDIPQCIILIYIYIYILVRATPCSVEVSHSQTNADATSQNSYGKNNKGTREY